MSTQSITHALPARAPYAARIIFGFLGRIQGGMLIVNGPDGFEETYGHDASGHAISMPPWMRPRKPKMIRAA